MPEVEDTRYRLVLKALRSEVPPEVRLRRLLKLLKRGFGMQCLLVEQVKTADVGGSPPAPAVQEPCGEF
jgi:hypothetical protein